MVTNVLLLYIITENDIRRIVNEIIEHFLKQSQLWDQLSVMTHLVSQSSLSRHKCCYLFCVWLPLETTEKSYFPTATYNRWIADKTRYYFWFMYCTGLWGFFGVFFHYYSLPFFWRAAKAFCNLNSHSKAVPQALRWKCWECLSRLRNFVLLYSLLLSHNCYFSEFERALKERKWNKSTRSQPGNSEVTFEGCSWNYLNLMLLWNIKNLNQKIIFR